MKKMIKNTITLIYAVAVIVLIGVAFCWLLHIRPAVVVSGSMEPVIGTGSIIAINERDKAIRTGDIIAYKTGDVSVAHRVVKIQDEGFVTKGDNNKSVDVGIVSKDMVEGTVIFQIPKVGYAVKWMANIPGMITIFAVVAGIIIIGYLINKEEICGEKK